MQPDSITVSLFKLWPWIEANRNRLIAGAGVVVVAGFAVWFAIEHNNQKETDAGMALTQAAFSVTSPSDAANAFLGVAKNYTRTKAGERALLQGATLLFVQNRFNEAQGQFQHFMDTYPGSDFVPNAALGLAACLDAQGKTDAAASAYKTVSSRYADNNASVEAKFSLARIYDSQGKAAEARSLYEDVARANTSSSLGQEAYVRALELNVKEPGAPAVSAPAATPKAFQLSNSNRPPATVPH